MKKNDVVPWVLKSILSRYIPSQNPHVRQAACVWLLSLVKKLSQHKEITVGVFPNRGLQGGRNGVLFREKENPRIEPLAVKSVIILTVINPTFQCF